MFKENNKELRKVDSKFSTYISNRGSGYSRQALDNGEIISYASKIGVLKTMRKCVLY